MYKTILFFSLCLVNTIFAQTITVNGPAGSGEFSKAIVMLINGNYVVTDPLYDEAGVQDIGAVYLYNGDTHALISTLKGSTAGDKVGGGSALVLNNGNFVVFSANWSNGVTTGVGAVTWVNGNVGLNGTISNSNSLVGSTTADFNGSSIVALTNGNYVVRCPNWDNGLIIDAGAVVWGNGNIGINGSITITNSLFGTTAADNVGGGGVTPLSNGNYLIISENWDNGTATFAGAVTWANGNTGIIGPVSSTNSLVGSTSNDRVGSEVFVLKNANYVVLSDNWSNGSVTKVGAVTWASSNSGINGIVNSSNSLVGSTTNDQVGFAGVLELSNGNFLIKSVNWNNGSIAQAGAVTWASSTAGITGTVSSSNSLVGSTVSDKIGNSGVIALSNGNYVVNSKDWNNGAIVDAGAVTWGNGSNGTSGVVSVTNSLVGNTANDRVGFSPTVPLSNGNYVVSSPFWKNGAATEAGAVTWGNGTLGINGIVSTTNSLVGSKANDQVGNIIALSNGNYVVRTVNWDNGTAIDVGAATWGSGTSGISGIISNANSLIGSTANDQIASSGIEILKNGNYVVISPYANIGGLTDTGAVTWGSGNTGISGVVSNSNSLVGSSQQDLIGNGGIEVLNNGNYIVLSTVWNNGSIESVGAVTWSNGIGGTVGVLSNSNSLIGSTTDDQIGSAGVVALANGNYVIRSPNWDNGAIVNAGAATWGNGSMGTFGTLSISNSLVGNTIDDRVSFNGVIDLINGNYVVRSHLWDNGVATNAGAITWGNGITGSSGVINQNNSLVGSTNADQIGSSGVFSLINGNYVVTSRNWDNGSIVNAAATTWGNGGSGTSGVVNSCNSVVGNITNSNSFSVSYDNQLRYYLLGKPDENRYYIFNPSGQLLANHLDNVTINMAGNTTTPLVNNDCRIIASITPNGSNPIAGSITAKTWIEGTQPTTYVKRHYEITPAINAATATGKVTLYFSQENFNDYNNQMPAPTDLLPTGPSDATGKMKLKIEKRGGTSNNGTGLPNTYTGSPSIIDPADSDIVWNAVQNRWEVSFDVSGFSGFFVTSQNSTLPLNLLSFSGKNTEFGNQLNWQTANETNFSHFEIERSENGKKFEKIGEVKGGKGEIYEFIDQQNSSFTTHSSSLFYRLRMVDLDGKFSYSKIINIENEVTEDMKVYPNPSSDYFSIQNNEGIEAIEIVDLVGKTIIKYTQQPDNQYTIKSIACGLYFVKMKVKNKTTTKKILIN